MDETIKKVVELRVKEEDRRIHIIIMEEKGVESDRITISKGCDLETIQELIFKNLKDKQCHPKYAY